MPQSRLSLASERVDNSVGVKPGYFHIAANRGREGEEEEEEEEEKENANEKMLCQLGLRCTGALVVGYNVRVCNQCCLLE